MRKLLGRFATHPLIDTLIHVKGNERACLYTEPLWGIPFNLYAPFVSVYMAALGMTPLMIGLVSTLFFVSQMFWAMMGGVLTDKLGRRLCTLIFDFACWSIPALIWMLAQNVYWFVAAALFNGMVRITENSWALLLVEEAPEDKLVHLYSLTNIAGLIAGFVTPLSYFFVQKYSVVPTMRFLYGLTFVLMTTKFVILYFITHETAVGQRRMEEFRHRSMLHHLWDSRHVLARMFRTRQIMLTVALLACYGAIRGVNDSFWSILITSKLGIDEKYLSLFATLRSLTFMVGYFLFVPRLDVRRFIKPMVAAFIAWGAVQGMFLVLAAGQAAFPLIALGVFTEALSLSVLAPLTSSLQILNVDREERARMNGLFLAMCLMFTSPMGVLAGALSEIDRSLPYVLTLALCGLGLFLALKVWRVNQTDGEAASE